MSHLCPEGGSPTLSGLHLEIPVCGFCWSEFAVALGSPIRSRAMSVVYVSPQGSWGFRPLAEGHLLVPWGITKDSQPQFVRQEELLESAVKPMFYHMDHFKLILFKKSYCKVYHMSMQSTQIIKYIAQWVVIKQIPCDYHPDQEEIITSTPDAPVMLFSNPCSPILPKGNNYPDF